jgi:xylulokinase
VAPGFARGAFVGLNLRHSFAHLTRAVMEGVVYSLKDSLDLITAMGMPAGEIRATGGGARSSMWRQLQADVFGVPVHRTRVDEGPAYGAALLAGVACGAYADVAEACSLIDLEPEVNAPDPALRETYERSHEIYADLYAATAPMMHRLASLSADNA